MSFFADSPFLKALGWALLNSLWQFAICWLIYRTISDGIKKLSAAARHTIALAMLSAGFAAFIAGLSWKYYADTTASAHGNAKLVVQNNYYYTIWHTTDTTMDVIMPYWSLLYLGCVVLLLIKFCLFVRRAGSLQNSGNSKMNVEWRMYVKNISAQLGIKKEVKALLSVHIDTPQVIGFFKPVILLPAACLVNLSPAQLEAVLLHELVHIKRNDYLVNLFVTSIEILFFFNPFVKQMTAAIRKEREYSCDDMVIQFQYQPHNYATALLTLEKNRMLPVMYGIAASGKNNQQLLTRIERIMGIQSKQNGLYKLGACLLALLLLGFIATINPAKVAVDNFGAGGLALALTENGMGGIPYNTEATDKISNPALIAVAIKKEDAQKSEPALTRLSPGKIAQDEDNNPAALQAETLALVNDNDDENDNLQQVTSKVSLEFSLKHKEAAALTTENIVLTSPTEPYVPANSFSFQLVQDTTMPKRKGETYSQRMAKDALLKAQIAIDQLNWGKIEKELKYSKHAIAKLKQQLTVQIQNLNWEKINNEVREQSNQEQQEKLLDAANRERELKLYQQNEAYHEAISKQLTEQEQAIKEASQRMQESQRAAELQQKKLQQELKKRRIIYI